MKRDRLAWISGLTGLGLILIGGAAYWRSRYYAPPTGIRGLGRAMAQAPVVGEYSDGNMKTQLRASRNMPIEERVATIQDLVHKSVQDPEMRKLALQVTSQCPERDQMCEAKAIYQAVKARVRYTGDVAPIVHPGGNVEGIDLYQSARRTWEFRGGDCDDHTILVTTMLALNGIEPILRIVKQKSDPDWSHIFPMGKVNSKPVALDTTLPGQRFGVEGAYSKKVDFPA